MATDYPVPLVDRLPIFVNEACSAAILMDMVCGGAPAQDESGDGSRWGIEEAGNSAVGGFGGQRRGGQRSGAPYSEQTSGDAGRGAVSDFSESEDDNAESKSRQTSAG